MKKRMTIMVIALIIVFGGLLGFNIIRSKMIAEYLKHYSPPAVTISTTKAIEKTWVPMYEAVGTITAINGVDVNTQAAGNVTKIHFESGEFVKKGTPLIDIDDQIEQATLKDTKALLALQEINYKRQVDLFKRNATSSSAVDEARANLQEAQASVEKTLASIDYKHIKAPFSGRLGIRLVDLGQYLTPGSSTIVNLQLLDPLYLQFYLPGQYLKNLYVNQPIRFAVDAYPGRLFEGKISAINSKIDENTNNILIQASVANCPQAALNNKPSTLIKTYKDKLTDDTVTVCNSQTNEKNNIKQFAFAPGMYANVSVILPSQDKKIVLPRTAIVYSLYGNSVYKVEKDSKSTKDKPVYKAYQHFITTGLERNTLVVIEKGVKEGEVIVNSGQLKLNNGVAVKINNDVELKPTDMETLGE